MIWTGIGMIVGKTPSQGMFGMGCRFAGFQHGKWDHWQSSSTSPVLIENSMTILIHHLNQQYTSSNQHKLGTNMELMLDLSAGFENRIGGTFKMACFQNWQRFLRTPLIKGVVCQPVWSSYWMAVGFTQAHLIVCSAMLIVKS